MHSSNTLWVRYGSTTLFVLLWSSGTIFARLSLDYASPFAVLAARFVLAFAALLVIGAFRRRFRPEPGSRSRVALAGVLATGGYSILYLLALAHGVTPGVLASIMGVQPILTLLLIERGYSAWRLLGLALALGGLVLVVQPRSGDTLSLIGLLFAGAALVSMTAGSILQKRIDQSPLDVLPLQYAVSLLACAALLPFQPLHIEWGSGFLVTIAWLAIVISVGAQILFYRLIRAGNLVSVTSLFYLVPPVTAILDRIFLGNALSYLGIAGIALIVVGLIVALRSRS
jgi:drug/metabolite transporter (DMT)-like permease